MPLVDTDKPKSPMTVWWLGSWLVGVCLWLAVLQLAFTGSVEVLTSSLVRVFMIVGLILSAMDGVEYVRGGEPHRDRVRGVRRDDSQVVEHEGREGVVVLNQVQPAPKDKDDEGSNKKNSAFLAIFYIAPRTLGDVMLTLLWKGLARALGRDARRTPPLPDEYPTGQFVRGATSRLRRLWS